MRGKMWKYGLKICVCIYNHLNFFFFFKSRWKLLFLFLIFIYLAVLGLSCGMQDLVPWPGIKPRPPALGTWSPKHWTTREVPKLCIMKYFKHTGKLVLYNEYPHPHLSYLNVLPHFIYIYTFHVKKLAASCLSFQMVTVIACLLRDCWDNDLIYFHSLSARALCLVWCLWYKPA